MIWFLLAVLHTFLFFSRGIKTSQVPNAGWRNFLTIQDPIYCIGIWGCGVGKGCKLSSVNEEDIL